MAGSVRLEAHVRTKTLDVGGGERREQTQLVEAGEGTLQPTIVADGARLEIVDVRMALELGERETVDVEARMSPASTVKKGRASSGKSSISSN